MQRIVEAIQKVLEHKDTRVLSDCRLCEPRTSKSVLEPAESNTAESGAGNDAPHVSMRIDSTAPTASRATFSPAACGASSSVSGASSPASGGGGGGGPVKILAPPEGAEDEHDGPGCSDEERQYFSVSEESEDEAAATNSIRRLGARSSKGAGASAASCDSAPASSTQVANLARRTEAFRRGCDQHMWTSLAASQIEVRSPEYFMNRRKQRSGQALFELVHADFQLVGPGGPVWRATDHHDFFPAHHWSKGDNRFLLVMNWVFPPFQAVLTGALDPEAAWLAEGTPQRRLWDKFLAMDETERKDVFKLICWVEEGPWLAKRALPKRPVLIGKKLPMRSFHEPGRYLEIVFDVASGRTEQVAVGIVCGALRRLQIAFSALIEAREDAELPENVMLSASMTNADPAKLFSPEAA